MKTNKQADEQNIFPINSTFTVQNKPIQGNPTDILDPDSLEMDRRKTKCLNQMCKTAFVANQNYLKKKSIEQQECLNREGFDQKINILELRQTLQKKQGGSQNSSSKSDEKLEKNQQLLQIQQTKMYEREMFLSDQEECVTENINLRGKNHIIFDKMEMAEDLDSLDDKDSGNSEDTVSNKTSQHDSRQESNKYSEEKIKQNQGELRRQVGNRPRETSFLTKINEPVICCECKVLDDRKNWIQVLMRVSSDKIQLSEPKSSGRDEKLLYSLAIEYFQLTKVKIYALDSSSQDLPQKSRENIIKINFKKKRKSLMTSFLNLEIQESIEISMKKSIKCGSLPIPFFIYGKIIAQKLKVEGINYSTFWQPKKVAPSLLLKRELSQEEKKYQKEQEILKKKMVIERKVQEQRQRERAETKKPNKTRKDRDQDLPQLSDNAYVRGFILKQSRHLKEWTQRYVEIDKFGLHSYSNLKQWSSSDFLQGEDKRPKEETFTIFKSEKVQYLWTRFETIDLAEIKEKSQRKSGSGNNKEESVVIKQPENQHKLMLIIKMKHNTWKSHKTLLQQQTQLGIPITNFCSKNPKNWLYYLYRIMQ